MFLFVNLLVATILNGPVTGSVAQAKFLAETSSAPIAPRIVVDAKGSFDMVDEKGRSCEKSDRSCREDLRPLQGSSLPLFISDRALRACGGDRAALAAEVEKAFSGPGRALETLRKGFDQSLFLNGDLEVIVVLDHLGSQIEKSRSFYLPHYPSKYQGRVVLDCQDSTRKEWAGLLAHEFAHVALGRSWVPGEAWQEEMIAQLLEVEAGGTQPEKNLRVLDSMDVWPGLSSDKPGEKVMNPALYAHSYAFGKYLMRVYGGWRFIRDLTAARLGDTGNCHTLYTPFDCAILTMARQGSFVESGAMHPYDFSAQELLTKFALATAMNLQQVPWLWMGGRFKTKTLNDHPSVVLKAHQFYVVDAGVELPKNKKISVYVLGPDINGRRRLFQTLENASREGWTKPSDIGSARLLIVNQSDGDLSLN